MQKTNKRYKIEAVGQIQVVERLPPAMSAKFHGQERRVDRIWEMASKEEGSELENETLFHFTGLKTERNQTTIYGHFIEYKYFFAQRKQVGLNLGIRPVGVSGIVLLEENDERWMVFAKREANVTEYPGCFELVPSGSLDKEFCDTKGVIDYQSKLLAEFVEETGLPGAFVQDVSSFAYILDQNHDVFDVCCKIAVEAEKETILKAFRKSQEYTHPLFVSTNQLGRFLLENRGRIVPTSLAILEVCGFMGVDQLD